MLKVISGGEENLPLEQYVIRSLQQTMIYNAKHPFLANCPLLHLRFALYELRELVSSRLIFMKIAHDSGHKVLI